MNEFMLSFSSNLISTLIGAVLGIPIALKINSVILKNNVEEKEKEKEIIHQNVKEVIMSSCIYNANVLKNIEKMALIGQVMHNPDLRVTTWSAISHMLSNDTLSPYILEVISHHWQRLNKLEKLNKELFDIEIGALKIDENSDFILEMWGNLIENSSVLGQQAIEIISLISKD
ncbi:hypothetical protein [Kluyvera georgiana]|uniref:hypothetical protein n=1 Tax=Kluyvera georgiana TaxID=73098 RepID=UPI0032209A5C